MADIARALGSHTERTESSNSTILTLAGAGLLAVLLIMAALLPFDSAPNPDFIPTFFGP